MTRPKRPLDERFWEKVDRRGPDECWPWMGAVDAFGYGRFNIDDRSEKAGRVALALTGIDPSFMEAIHSCDNPPCCNPAHLRVATHAENMADMGRKGRASATRKARERAVA